MKPSYLSALTLMLLPGTPLYKDYRAGDFEILDARSVLEELRVLVQNIDTEGTVFRTNHASNYLPLGGCSHATGTGCSSRSTGGWRTALLRPESRRAL